MYVYQLIATDERVRNRLRASGCCSSNKPFEEGAVPPFCAGCFEVRRGEVELRRNAKRQSRYSRIASLFDQEEMQLVSAFKLSIENSQLSIGNYVVALKGSFCT